MKEQDLDETQYMDPKENQRFKKNMIRSAEDTQPLSSIESRDDINNLFLRKKGMCENSHRYVRQGICGRTLFMGFDPSEKNGFFLVFLFCSLP